VARFREPTPEQLAAWKEWVAERPPAIRAAAEKLDPWSLYRLKNTDNRVTFYSLSEGEGGEITATVNVTGEFNKVVFERRVFGIALDDMEPCDLPGPDEDLGALLTDDDEIKAYIDAIRPEVLANRRKPH
jgi:hypothetical protein